MCSAPFTNSLCCFLDDIEIEDPKEKPRGYPVIEGLNKQSFTNTFQALKGKPGMVHRIHRYNIMQNCVLQCV